jgi:uncharacterized damage-inducible protein DinB
VFIKANLLVHIQLSSWHESEVLDPPSLIFGLNQLNGMPTAGDYRRIFEYNEKVLRSFFEALSKLPWDTVAKNMEASHRSMKNILVHILTVGNGWINYNAQGKSDKIPWEDHDYENYHSMDKVGKFMSRVMVGVEDFMKRLDDGDLSKTITAPWMAGEHELGDVLMQVTFEQAHHLGEIIALLWQLNIEPPEMTWIMNT